MDELKDIKSTLGRAIDGGANSRQIAKLIPKWESEIDQSLQQAQARERWGRFWSFPELTPRGPKVQATNGW
jgi:hypothetical protein